MQNKTTSKKTAEYKAGMFIIISLAMLIFSILWLRYFSIRPEMEITAEFTNPGPLTKGLQVYYQGVVIGKVSNIDFSKDFKFTLVKISIYRKGLNLPANVKAKIDSQGITGQKFISIIYPDKPVKQMLRNGSMILGESPFSIADFQEALGEQIKNGNFKKLLTNLSESLELQKELSIKMEKLALTMNDFIDKNRYRITLFLDEAIKSTNNLNKIFMNINEIVSDKEIKQNIKSTVKTANNTACTLNKILKSDEFNNSMANLNQITGNVSAIISDKEMQENLKSSVKLFAETENTLSQLKTSGIFDANTVIEKYFPQNGCNVFDLAVETLCNANQAAKSVNCLSQGMSDIFNKRFSMMRLLFGKPGDSLEACKNINKLSKEQTECLTKQGIILPNCPVQK
jgi:ABC-type transporter Mla subunit MlaD